jgi:hypothetical protein
MKFTGPQSVGGGGGGLPGVTVPLITFTVGAAGAPAAGTTVFHFATFQGQSLANKQLFVNKENQPVPWNTSETVGTIQRFNDGTQGGFDWIAPVSFEAGDRFQIYITGINNTIE